MKSLLISIKNLINWLPVIWIDRQYDHYFIYNILQFKLEKQAKYISKYSHHVDRNYDVMKINTCVRLIKKLKNDEYEMEFYDHLKKKYGISNVNFIKATPAIKKDCKEMMKTSIEKHKKAKRILFKLLESNIENWWD
jgi:hypothetical protein